MSWQTVEPYQRGFREFAATYEAVGFEDVHFGALPFLPAQVGLLLDVGSGSGRDANWFAQRDWDVVAVEPAAAMRADAAARHTSPRIRWIDDDLPGLPAVHKLGLEFDLVWLSGVWMHVPPQDRPRAMRKLATLLKPGGRMVVTLRHGPAPADRPMWPVSLHEVERLGLDTGLALRVATSHAKGLQAQPDVLWQTVVLDLPDDGAGALPLLRGVILRQEKSATYKLALLRCLARIADASANVARETHDGVELPLGLVALYWIRMFKPIIQRGLPQRPGSNMGFVTDAFLALNEVAASDLRPGAVFTGLRGAGLRKALAHSARLIADMPARHLTFADDRPVFQTSYGRMPAISSAVCMEQDYLWTYGTVHVPLPIWQALRRMSAWIEPMLVAEWVRLTRSYGEKMGRTVTADEVLLALRWSEPERDTGFVRELAQKRIARGQPVACVWSGRPLSAGMLDIDHCLPWSAWQCGDLWNLLPSTATINRSQKREKIVTGTTLAQAKPLILSWWKAAYQDESPALRTRFAEEARATLPIEQVAEPSLEELFQALDFRRLRLRQDTLAAEWAGASLR